jgi:hypothetical protein
MKVVRVVLHGLAVTVANMTSGFCRSVSLMSPMLLRSQALLQAPGFRHIPG